MLVIAKPYSAPAFYGSAVFHHALSGWPFRLNAMLVRYNLKTYQKKNEGINNAPIGCVKNLAIEKANKGASAAVYSAHLKRDIAVFIENSSSGQMGYVLRSASICGAM